MVRYRLSHFEIPENTLFLPDYHMEWVYFDPNNPLAPCQKGRWITSWEREEGRDFVHRINSKHIARLTGDEGASSATGGAYSTLAIILCFVIVACIVVPQFLQILSALCFRSSRPPPTPPSPPQVPKNRKRLRLYYFRHGKKTPNPIEV